MKRNGNPDVARLIAAQERLFNIRRTTREGQRAQLDERIAQLRQGATGLEAQEAAKVNEIEWIRKELEGIMSLAEESCPVHAGRGPAARPCARLKAIAASSSPRWPRARTRSRKSSCKSSRSTRICG